MLLTDLLGWRNRVVARSTADVGALPRLAGLLVTMTLCSGLYGAVLGWWRAPQMAVYAAVKLPLMMVTTAALTLAINWVIGVLLGIELSLRQVAVITVMSLTWASVLLASLAPVAWLFTICAPAPGVEARITHNLLYLFHTAAVGICGLAGSRFLRDVLRRAAPSERVGERAYWAWLVSFAFVGGEVAWALRPFVGSIYYPIALVRPDALRGNVYEFIFTDILPFLLGR